MDKDTTPTLLHVAGSGGFAVGSVCFSKLAVCYAVWKGIELRFTECRGQRPKLTFKSKDSLLAALRRCGGCGLEREQQLLYDRLMAMDRNVFRAEYPGLVELAARRSGYMFHDREEELAPDEARLVGSLVAHLGCREVYQPCSGMGVLAAALPAGVAFRGHDLANYDVMARLYFDALGLKHARVAPARPTYRAQPPCDCMFCMDTQRQMPFCKTAEDTWLMVQKMEQRCRTFICMIDTQSALDDRPDELCVWYGHQGGDFRRHQPPKGFRYVIELPVRDGQRATSGRTLLVMDEQSAGKDPCLIDARTLCRQEAGGTVLDVERIMDVVSDDASPLRTSVTAAVLDEADHPLSCLFASRNPARDAMETEALRYTLLLYIDSNHDFLRQTQRWES